MEEDYDMVPHHEILKLKKEVEDLKSGTGSEIRKAMQDLTASVIRMNEILKEATEGMKKEESDIKSSDIRKRDQASKKKTWDESSIFQI